MTPASFIAKWSKADLSERASYQQHFLDLCALVGHPTPAALDATGESFAFEKGAAKHEGGDGFADVWKRGCFAIEYKGRPKNLARAYDQLLQYREALETPPRSTALLQVAGPTLRRDGAWRRLRPRDHPPLQRRPLHRHPGRRAERRRDRTALLRRSTRLGDPTSAGRGGTMPTSPPSWVSWANAWPSTAA